MVRHGRACPCEHCHLRYGLAWDWWVAVGFAVVAALVMIATSDYAQRVVWALLIQWGS